MLDDDHLSCERCGEPLDRNALRLGNWICSECSTSPGWCRVCGRGLKQQGAYFCVNCGPGFFDV
jgi:hypothetical protein